MDLRTFLLPLAVVVGVTLAQCPFGAIQGPKADRCYALSEITRNFWEADADCKSQTGNLASVSSAFENSAIRKFLAGIRADDDYWLGGHATTPGNWQWSDGTNFTYTNWDRGQPQAQPAQGLAIKTRTGKWLSAHYTVSKLYVCEVPPLAQSPPTGR